MQLHLTCRLPLILAAAIAAARAQPLQLSDVSVQDIQIAMDRGDLTAEKLTAVYLERIEAYDQSGPHINALISINPNAMETARALDRERAISGPRSPLHGVPIILKDNIDTADLPTTAGCAILAGSLPPDDAFLVKRLRDAGAIVLAKANLSEFASGGGAPEGYSSMGGQTRNPHDLSRGPSGSSGGPGAAVAAAFAQIAIGTDTSSSIRAPCSANGVTGIRPTLGLVSRDGIVPLSLSFDTAGPMARNVLDVAVTLNVIAGEDSDDDATAVPASSRTDYTEFLKPGALEGARIGVARMFLQKDVGVSRVLETCLVRLQQLGATLVDPVEIPRLVLESRNSVYHIIRHTEFPIQVNHYLGTLGDGYPHTLADLLTRAENPENGYLSPWKLKDFREELQMPGYDNPAYQAARNHGLPMVRETVAGIFAQHRLDAIIYPTLPTPAQKIDEKNTPRGPDALNLAALTGSPEVVIPAGFTTEGLPVTVSFLGVPFSDARLLGYAYEIEQVLRISRLPRTTPAIHRDVE